MSPLHRFISTENGHIPLAGVQSAVHSGGGLFELRDAEGRRLDERRGEHFFTMAAEIEIDRGPFELLTLNVEKHQSPYTIDLVAGWVLTVAGRVLPFTAADLLVGDIDDLASVPGHLRAIRHVDYPRVYAPSGTFDNADAWVTAERSDRARAMAEGD